MNLWIARIIRAIKLEPALYEEVEADKTALTQAMGVVVLSSVAAGVAMMVRDGLAALVFSAVAALVGWVIWALIIYLIGGKLFSEPQTKTDIGELLRCLGFASAPGLIRVLGIFTFLAPFVFIVAAGWMVAATVIAVRQALDYTSTARAILVCLIGWFIQFIAVGILLAAGDLMFVAR